MRDSNRFFSMCALAGLTVTSLALAGCPKKDAGGGSPSGSDHSPREGRKLSPRARP
jgi:hypothetical protein